MIIDWGWITLCQWIPSFDRTNHWSGCFHSKDINQLICHDIERWTGGSGCWRPTWCLTPSYIYPPGNVTYPLPEHFWILLSQWFQIFLFPRWDTDSFLGRVFCFIWGGLSIPFSFLRWALAFLSLTVGSPIPAFRSTIPVAAVSVVPTPPPTNLPTTPQPQLFLGRLPADVTQEELERTANALWSNDARFGIQRCFFFFEISWEMRVMKRENMKVNSEVPEC